MKETAVAIPRMGVNSIDFVFSPWTALVKTSTMFVGELEFADVAGVIDPKASTAPLAFAFLLAFVFLIVVVLMR